MSQIIRSENKGLFGVSGLCALALLGTAGCGPMYYQDRDDGYYQQNAPYEAQPAPQPGYAPPAQQPAPQGYGYNQQVDAAAPEQYFSDLGSYGAWSYTPEYGRVWIPYSNRTPGWRPYFYGSWEYTDYGWTWVSSEPWGAGPYHYGRWAWMPGYQWVWVPGYTWAPAWVVWGHGGGCVGWAPMGPGYSASVTIHHSYWVYVPQNQMASTQIQHVVIPAAEVPRVYNQTVIIDSGAQIRAHDGSVAVYSRGPASDQASQWMQRPIQPRAIDQVPRAQPRQIPASAIEPPAGRAPRAQAEPAPSRQPLPDQATPGQRGVPPARQGYQPSAQPPGARQGVSGEPAETPGRQGYSQPDPRSVPAPTARPGSDLPPAATPSGGREGTPEPGRPGYAPAPQRTPTAPPTYEPPSRPGAGYQPPTTEPPSRPGAGYQPPPTYQPPSRPGAGYQAPVREAPQPPRETPQPPREAPQPTRPSYEQPSRPTPPPVREAPAPQRGYEPPARPSQPPPLPQRPSYESPARAPALNPGPGPVQNRRPSNTLPSPAPMPQRRGQAANPRAR